MKTTQQWLSEIKEDPENIIHWLKRQYIGEALAADRIHRLADAAVGRHQGLLMKIAHDERTHSDWIKGLLKSRGIDLPEVTLDNTRYWKPILDNLQSFDEIAGAGYHAETMRLVRIRALAADKDIAEDIRQVFTDILPDEEMHAKAFEIMSTPEAIAKTQHLHKAGLEVLGLEI